MRPACLALASIPQQPLTNQRLHCLTNLSKLTEFRGQCSFACTLYATSSHSWVDFRHHRTAASLDSCNTYTACKPGASACSGWPVCCSYLVWWRGKLLTNRLAQQRITSQHANLSLVQTAPLFGTPTTAQWHYVIKNRCHKPE